MIGSESPVRLALAALSGVAGLLLSMPDSSAAQSRGFVVSWFHVAESFDAEGRDCPHGLNDDAPVFYRRELKRIGKSEAEIDQYISEFLDLSKHERTIPVMQMRGRIDGKPVDAYANPESVPDPHLKVVEGPYSYGFDLDGKDNPGDFIDPETGEHGVDNQLYRALGCMSQYKPHTPTDRTSAALTIWNIVYEQMPAWLVEISGIDDPRNDDDVTVGIYRAVETPSRFTNGDTQPNLTFTADPNPRWQNVVHGRIKDGVLTTDAFEMDMLGDPFWIAEFHFKQARLRLKIAPDGSLTGILGGYTPWFPFYWEQATEGWGVEATTSIDIPGFYYTLKRLADADPDPKTGQNRAISSAFRIEAVPAFILHPDNRAVKTAAEGAAQQ
jgi:hypothetical protein